MDFKIKYLNIERYETLALEKYLEDMAIEGWHLAYLNANILRFKKGERVKVKYSVKILEKLSYVDDANGVETLDLRKEYAEAGWELVTAQGNTNIFVTRDISAKTPSNNSFKEDLTCAIKESQNSIILKLLAYIIGTIFLVNNMTNINWVYDFNQISWDISILFIFILAILYNVFDLIDFLRFKRNFKEFIENNNYIEFSSRIKGIKGKVSFSSLMLFLFDLLIIQGSFQFTFKASGAIAIIHLFIVLVIFEVKYRVKAKREDSKKYIWILIIFHIAFIGLILKYQGMETKILKYPNIEPNLTLKDFNKKDGKKYYYRESENTLLANLIGYWEGNNGDCLSYDFIEVKYDFLVETYYKDVIDHFRKDYSSKKKVLYSYEEIKGLPNGLRGVDIIDSRKRESLVFNRGNKIIGFYLHENISQEELIRIVYEKLK